MLFNKLTFAIMSGVVLMALFGGAAASWVLAPEECSRDNLHCLVVQEGAFGGFKTIYCVVSWEKDWGIFKVYAFNRGCSGQIIMNCPEQKTQKVQRALTWFQFGPTSFFSTPDENVQGKLSDGQPFAASPASYNNLHVHIPWSDFFFECRSP